MVVFRISGDFRDFRGHDTYFAILARGWGELYRNKVMSPEIYFVYFRVYFRGHDTYFPILARGWGGVIQK